jgi:hypothetical protein
VVLTAAVLGMAGYGTLEVIFSLTRIVSGPPLELWALAAQALLGVVLVIAAAFVRVRLPGGLALAIGALLGFQALALHNAIHDYGSVVPLLQVTRGIFAAALIGVAHIGSRRG